ncbi:MAG: hypothetical protein HY749_12170 [Gammaproteobacteria bacterium]|nr:hypothetical protein [Gammaproteobacteria bacterium]MBI5616173.1 hypothetical protein [Gammaproteobacteria bacterium]
MNNRDRLIDFMSDYKLERRDIAELVLVDRDTVDRWLLPPSANRRNDIPDMAIELLSLKLAARPKPAPELPAAQVPEAPPG